MFSFKIVVIMNPANRKVNSDRTGLLWISSPRPSCTTVIGNNLQSCATAEILELFDVLGTVGVVPYEANGNALTLSARQ
ncbi:hypothetical protein V1477_016635 [Vespula maculifrons]|uniref:Uncharacterized protein n=1 Tax=Vespula maculifrons TaxID=7453 RepID=A0ABD2B8U0_VESMC